MQYKDLLFAEANRNTAAIMGLLDGAVNSPDMLLQLSKQIGDILHTSRRRILEESDDRTNGTTIVGPGTDS